jgi:uracil-DNA glycosylase family 4
MYLRPYGIDPSREWYLTNVVKEYQEGNPDPDPERIAAWSIYLEKEIGQVQPELVVAIGRFAAEWFLEEPISMDKVHGIPFERVSRANGATVIPVFHPAAGLHQPRYQPFIQWDYKQVATYIGHRGMDRPLVQDEWFGREEYHDVTGKELARLIADRKVLGRYALDTEGTPGSPWSIQVSSFCGTGYTLRCVQKDFTVGIDSLQRISNLSGAQVIVHNGLYDIPMAREMGLELAHVPIWDTMYALYLLGFEAQGLKPAAFRFCGMEMDSFAGLTDGAGKAKQLDWLRRAAGMSWTIPTKRTVRTNNGIEKSYKPAGIARKLARILKDVDAKGIEAVNLFDRWYTSGGDAYAKAAAKEAVREVEDVLGPLPVPTLSDVPPSVATRYASRDADAALRLKPCLERELARYDLTDLMASAMRAFPVAEEIQATGMPASRPYFEQLHADMMRKAYEIQDDIITSLGRSEEGFNPGSSKQVAAVLESRGLKGMKHTKKTGAISTSAKSIRHLAAEDSIVRKLFQFRTHRKLATDFCVPILDRTPVGSTAPHFVHSKWMITRTTSRRYATSGKGSARESGFNLMNIPIRTELGKLVRLGYICPEGYTFGSWDYSKIEPRVLAHLSNDELMKQIFFEGRNIYKETAARIWGISVDEVTPEQYTVAKETTLGSMYGMGPQTLQEQIWAQGLLSWTIPDCEQLLSDFWDVFAGAAEYKRNVASDARKPGYVRDHWGHYRYLPAINSWDKKARAKAERHAVSHKVQPMAQGMLQNATAHLREQLDELRTAGCDVRMCLQMHDEIVLIYEDRPGFGEELDSLVVDSMVNRCGVELSVPVVAEGVHGKAWGELK